MNPDIIACYDEQGRRTERPKPRHSCGEILDPHPTRDAAVCRGCGATVDHVVLEREVSS